MFRLKELRIMHNLSQIEFAKKFNVAQNTVSNWENGNRQIDSETLKEIADFFKVTTDYLLERTDSPKIPSLDEQLEGIDFALFGEVQEMTDEQKQDVLDYIQYKKSKNK